MKIDEKLKAHWEKYKQTYITVGVSIAVGVMVGVGVYVLTKQKNPNIKVDISGNTDSNPIGVNLGTLNYTVEANRQGPPSWVVRCLETGEVFSSQRKAAEELGVSDRDISTHLNGMKDNVGGLHFERICMSA